MSFLLSTAPAFAVFEFCLAAVFLRDKGLPLSVSLCASFLIFCVQLLIAESRWNRRKLIFSAALALISVLISTRLFAELEEDPLLPKNLDAECVVAERRKWGDSGILRLKDSLGSEWIMREPKDAQSLHEGDRIRVRASVFPLKKESERNSFNPLRYWRARGVHGELQPSSITLLSKEFSFHCLRQRLRERIALLPPKSAALTAAVLLGDREENLAEDHRRWGTNHILAVSGWHVGIVVALGGVIWGSGRKALIANSLLLWGYCFLSGASMSALRAACMLQFSMGALWYGRGGHLANSLSVAVLAMLVYNPWAAFDIGWQLSVLAVFALIGLSSFGTTASACLTSPLIWFTASPITAPLAGGLSISALPINIMASVCFTFILGVVLLASLPTLIGFSGNSFSSASEFLLTLWGQVADQWVEWLPRAYPVHFFPSWLCAAVFFLCVGRSLRLSLFRSFLMSLLGAGVVMVL